MPAGLIVKGLFVKYPGMRGGNVFTLKAQHIGAQPFAFLLKGDA